MRVILAILWKQIKDSWHNKSVLIQFALLPILSLVAVKLLPEEAIPKRSVAAMFTAMYMGMTPLSCMCSILAEEREKGSLRCLKMAGVGSGQYLFGIGSCLFIESLFGIIVFSVLGKYSEIELMQFVGIAVLGLVPSLLLGATLGLLAKNQMSATSLSAPIAAILSFLPTLASMNEDVRKVSKYLFTYQLNELLLNVESNPFTSERMMILGANLLMLAVVFAVIYRKKGLRD